MGVLLTIACYLIAFSPVTILFLRFIAKDPLRIILFVLGAFFWLCSLLISGVCWFTLFPLRETLGVSIILSIGFQELARVIYFILLRKAQHGLHRMASASGGVQLLGVSDLQNSRHMLALVCGLGMGTLAALFLTMNVFASFSGPGTIGLPAALSVEESLIRFTTANRHLSIFYAVSGGTLILLHATWTIQMWDSCHKHGHDASWYYGGTIAVVTHLAVSTLSFLNESGNQMCVSLAQIVILVMNMAYCYRIMGGTCSGFGTGVSSALVSWITLEWIRSKFASPKADPTDFSNTVEVDAEERVSANGRRRTVNT